MAKKEKDPAVKPDEFTADGVRLFNPTKPHGIVYGDGKIEAAFVQEGVEYKADRMPVRAPEPVQLVRQGVKNALPSS